MIVVVTNLKIIDPLEVHVEVFEVYVAQDRKITKKTMKKRKTIISNQREKRDNSLLKSLLF